ncbi:unnamed protein product [Trifolium pratense]|uniref:Uncharacterized protein n=1 Tax=Trifolium pratense TaxID=57577 RepID=A0ACB0JD00_TRIPR|nr:unnamed protein product [Trifolium pratense]
MYEKKKKLQSSLLFPHKPPSPLSLTLTIEISISHPFKFGFVSLELGTCKEITPLKMTESLARPWVVWMARTS